MLTKRMANVDASPGESLPFLPDAGQTQRGTTFKKGNKVIKPKILVTSAAGKTGFQTTRQLLEQGYPVRALVHRSDARSRALRKSGAEVVLGSLDDIVEVGQALQDIRRAYFCAPLLSGCLSASAVFARAAQAHKLEVVVVMSQWLADPTHHSIHTRETALADTVFSWMPDVDVITVNPGWFADNYMAAMEPIAQFGLMPMPLGAGLNAPPSNEDIARVIVGALTNPGPHLGKTYRPTGPRLLSPQDIAATYAKVLGRPVKYVDAPIRMFSKVAAAMGFPEFVIAQLQWYFQDYQKNAFAKGAPTDAVLEVGGKQPDDFESIVRRYAAASPFAKRTFGSRLAAMWGLMKAMMTPAPDLERYARIHDFPRPANASFAADSAAWRSAHEAIDLPALPEEAAATSGINDTQVIGRLGLQQGTGR